MNRLLGVLLLVMVTVDAGAAQEVPVERFAHLALECVHQEYPNKIAHVMSGDEDLGPPRSLTPIFYGCFDWHSAVHGHWLLTRLVRLHPDAEFAEAARAALDKSFTAQNAAGELEYIQHSQRASFERPYGIAWLLQLTAELREWDDPQAAQWLQVLKPLEAAYVKNTSDWLQKLAYPIRIGEHAQTAFAFALFLDWARVAGDEVFLQLVKQKSLEFYSGDTNCPLAYEPGGQDFLSPCLAEADLMRRVMNRAEYAEWLSRFLPGIPEGQESDIAAAENWLPLARVTDRTDGKLAHLDGLNLSRAWALEGVIDGLPDEDARIPSLRAAADSHAQAGLAAVTGEHYEGGHWLGSFATYLVTQRGIR